MVAVSQTGFLYVSLGNLTSNVQSVKKGALMGTTVPVVLVYRVIAQVAHDQQTKNQSTANFLNIYEQVNINTSSEYSSSSEFEFLLSTDPSELGLSLVAVVHRSNSCGLWRPTKKHEQRPPNTGTCRGRPPKAVRSGPRPFVQRSPSSSSETDTLAPKTGYYRSGIHCSTCYYALSPTT